MGSFGGIIVALFLLILGVFLISGLLDFILWILGAICIILAIIIGAMALFGNKQRY